MRERTDGERWNRRELLVAVGVAGGLAGCVESTDGGAYDGYLSEANGFDEPADRTGNDEVTVEVGAGQDGLAFAPAAVQVTPGTTVVWEWTGKGGRHNVVAEDGAFQSPLYVGVGRTFSETFDEPDVVEYLCEPHETQGMLGVVEVLDA